VRRRLFGPKRKKEPERRSNLHNEDVQNVCSSPNIRAINSRRVSWVEHVASMRDEQYI